MSSEQVCRCGRPIKITGDLCEDCLVSSSPGCKWSGVYASVGRYDSHSPSLPMGRYNPNIDKIKDD